jgi:NADH:ubiquinone oxidoreductase subunit F (NADH-binding)
VAGEETAAVRALNGGPVKPTDKPPRPYEEGVDGRPTLVSNVETLANLPYLQNRGSAAFRSLGTSLSPGTFLATITGAGRSPVLYELPLGTPFTELLSLHGISPDQVRGALMGGYFAGLLNRGVLETTLDYETMRGLGSGLGCGAVSIITDDCPVALRPRRMWAGCDVGRWCCAGVAPAQPWTPPATWRPPCSTSSPTKSPPISKVAARTAKKIPAGRSAPTVPTRRKL